jgi:hypothetical protein
MYNKYLKYKKKYLALKKQLTGGDNEYNIELSHKINILLNVIYYTYIGDSLSMYDKIWCYYFKNSILKILEDINFTYKKFKVTIYNPDSEEQEYVNENDPDNIYDFLCTDSEITQWLTLTIYPKENIEKILYYFERKKLHFKYDDIIKLLINGKDVIKATEYDTDQYNEIMELLTDDFIISCINDYIINNKNDASKLYEICKTNEPKQPFDYTKINFNPQ